MTDFPVSQAHHQSFEGIRQQDETGNEFWSARDLAPLLEYQDWRNFMQVADKLAADPARYLSRIPLNRIAEPEDIANAVVFLASAASDYVNGHTLAVDGGWLAR